MNPALPPARRSLITLPFPIVTAFLPHLPDLQIVLPFFTPRMYPYSHQNAEKFSKGAQNNAKNCKNIPKNRTFLCNYPHLSDHPRHSTTPPDYAGANL
jgi:hypothetical protein